MDIPYFIVKQNRWEEKRKAWKLLFFLILILILIIVFLWIPQVRREEEFEKEEGQVPVFLHFSCPFRSIETLQQQHRLFFQTPFVLI